MLREIDLQGVGSVRDHYLHIFHDGFKRIGASDDLFVHVLDIRYLS